MADIDNELGDLAKTLVRTERYEKDEDVRLAVENARRFLIVVQDVLDIFDYQLTKELTHAAGGNRKRARQVTRPIRLASMLVLAGNRRLRMTWTNFLKIFAEELANASRGNRRDPFKFGG